MDEKKQMEYKMLGIELLEISFSDSNYGVSRVMPQNLHEVIKKYVALRGVENCFVNGHSYQGDRIDYENP